MDFFKGSSFETQGLNRINKCLSGRQKCTWKSTDTETFTDRKVVFLGPSTWLRGWQDLPLLRKFSDKVCIILLISKKLLKKARKKCLSQPSLSCRFLAKRITPVYILQLCFSTEILPLKWAFQGKTEKALS